MNNLLLMSAALTVWGFAAKDAAAPSVQVSTQATVSSLYNVDRLRDPFTRLGATQGGAKSFSLESFSIHKLSLRGVMKDATSQFALFSDGETGVTFLLRQGRLYDPKGKAVPGIGGTMDIKRKMATLTAADGDVQIFHLGTEGNE